MPAALGAQLHVLTGDSIYNFFSQFNLTLLLILIKTWVQEAVQDERTVQASFGNIVGIFPHQREVEEKDGDIHQVANGVEKFDAPNIFFALFFASFGDELIR
jgi:hypothetical protein